MPQAQGSVGRALCCGLVLIAVSRLLLGQTGSSAASALPAREAQATQRGGRAADPALEPRFGLRRDGIGFPFTAVQSRPEPTIGWFVQPSLGLSLEFNDNIRYSAHNRQPDAILRVVPGLLVRSNTPRLVGTLSYTPALSFYASNSRENRLSHAGNAQLLTTVVQERVFVDARASAFTANLFGGFVDNTIDGTRRNEIQTITASVSPYFVQRFGGLADARAGYTFAVTDQTRRDASNFAPQSFISHTGYATVRTGEDFGRFVSQANVFGTTFDGEGIFENAYRWGVSVENGYALTRWLSVLGDIGYERIRFNTVPKTDISGITWGVGVRLRPSETADATVKFGRRDGYDAFEAFGSTNLLGPRTRLFVNYSDRLTNSALRTSELLQTTTLDPFGNPVFAANAGPISPNFSDSFLGVQNGLFKTRSASATIQHTRERDQFSLSLFHEDRRPFAADPRLGRQVSSKGTAVTLAWSRALDELTNLTSFATYGVRSIGGVAPSDGQNYSLGAVLTRRFTPTLSGSLSYRFNLRDEDTQDDMIYQNVVVAALRQTF